MNVSPTDTHTHTHTYTHKMPFSNDNICVAGLMTDSSEEFPLISNGKPLLYLPSQTHSDAADSAVIHIADFYFIIPVH